MLDEGLVGARGDQHALPFVLRGGIGLGQGGDAAGGLDQPGEEIGALQIARDPVEIVGGAGEHGLDLAKRSEATRSERDAARVRGD